MEAAFLTELDVRELPNGFKQLLGPLAFFSAELRGTVVAPRDFITDYASSPRPFWAIVPKDGPWTWAAVIHDAAYVGALLTPSGEVIHLIKPLADKLFKEAMSVPPCVNQVAGWKRWIMYGLVVLYGGKPYQGLGAAA
jgi:hypothetical protein